MPAFPPESDLFPAGALAPATAKTKWQAFFQAVTALLGTSGTAADARTALGAAAKGANGDITQLTGLTTPLSIDQGGSGAADVASALRNLGITSLPVRQTVLAGPVDSNGASAFGGSTGSTTVTASGTLVAAAANGFNVSGQVNRVGSITNPSWTGLNTNGTMYLGLLVNADGTCTPFSTTLAPNYQWGGTYSTTNNQRTFNIQEMCMKKGNGASAAQAYEVFVGEVTVSGGAVTAITWYALMGRAYVSQASLTANAVYVLNHNVGTNLLKVSLWYENKVAEGNYSVGDRVHINNADGDGSALFTGMVGAWDSKVLRAIQGSSSYLPNKTAVTRFSATLASWGCGAIVQRAW